MSQEIINILSGVLFLIVVICVPVWISMFIENGKRLKEIKASDTTNTPRQKRNLEPLQAFRSTGKLSDVLTKRLQEYPNGLESGYLFGYITTMRPL